MAANFVKILTEMYAFHCMYEGMLFKPKNSAKNNNNYVFIYLNDIRYVPGYISVANMSLGPLFQNDRPRKSTNSRYLP